MPPSSSMGVVMVNQFVLPLLLVFSGVAFKQPQWSERDADPSFLAARCRDRPEEPDEEWRNEERFLSKVDADDQKCTS